MPRTLREFDCADCGARTRRTRHSYDPWICAACGRQRIRDAQLRRWHPDHAYTPGRDAEVPHPEE